MKFIFELLFSLVLMPGVSWLAVDGAFLLFHTLTPYLAKKKTTSLLSLQTFYDGWLYGTPEITISGKDIEGQSTK